MSYQPSCNSTQIHKLPTEVLSYIFALTTHALEEQDASDGGRATFTGESARTPRILSAVCRHWRVVAMNTPALWTNICLSIDHLKILGYDDDDHPQRSNDLYTPELDAYLAYSKKYPLDIVIDARDQDWDLTEPEIVVTDESDYVHPFTQAHMETAMAILSPHMTRWRSIDILTDTWAPMYGALSIMRPMLGLGAQMLESLTLMRCNLLASHAPIFEPEHMRTPAFLDLRNQTRSRVPHILPHLQTLALRGIPTDWSTLADVLSQSHCGGLRSLEIKWLARQVCPTIIDLHRILVASPLLTTLVLDGAGPTSPLEIQHDASIASAGIYPVSLPALKTLHVGYRSAAGGRLLFELLDAPNVTTLILEDATRGGTVPVDGGPLLRYLGTRTYQYRGTFPPPVYGDATPFPFPCLERVTLRYIQCTPADAAICFAGLPHLRELETCDMLQEVASALRVGSPATFRSPCPQLRSLCIRMMHRPPQQALAGLGFVAAERLAAGLPGLGAVTVHVGYTAGGTKEHLITSTHGPWSTQIAVLTEAPEEDEMDSDDEDGMAQ